MRATVNKCPECGWLTENDSAFAKHEAGHADTKALNALFPVVEDKGCDFANGGWSVRRSKEWLDEFKKAVASRVPKSEYSPFSYGWMRTLDDGGSRFYQFACRAFNVCPTCYREWGQSFYANNCNHSTAKDRK